MLSKLRHRHLASLIRNCEELNEMILVMSTWSKVVCEGTCMVRIFLRLLGNKGLKSALELQSGWHYRHKGVADSIIHHDMKTTNMLLDECLTAKGSFGYLDLDYYRRQQLTEKLDANSLGVVLLMVLCARPPINPALPREQVNIAEWAMSWQKKVT
ncbi:hypothetical protein FF1_001249 [Malus domestica]